MEQRQQLEVAPEPPVAFRQEVPEGEGFFGESREIGEGPLVKPGGVGHHGQAMSSRPGQR